MPMIYDVSVPVVNGGLVYPGNPAIAIAPQQEVSKGGSSNVSSVSFGSHTGTHVDAPKHFFDDGITVDMIPLETLMGPAVLICVEDDVMSVGEKELKLHELAGHTRVLIKSRNSAFIRKPEFVKDYTYLAPDGAAYLVSLGVKLIGVDYLSVEQFHSGHHMTHRTLLENGVVIVEGLDLSGPAMGPYELRVLPLRLAGLDGAPARAVLVGMMLEIDLVLFDIGGVLGSNGWDHEQRTSAVQRFGLDADDFQYRHEETVGALESGHMSLDEYLDVTVFCAPRDFNRDEFKAFMFAQSEPWPASIAVVRELADSAVVRLATLNNESESLNVHRIETFGLRDIFPVFFSSCWLGIRKPMRQMYTRALGMAQADPARTLFVDDRLQNLNPAAALGMKTIQFESADQLRRALREQGLLT